MLTGSRYGEVPQLQQGWLDENTTHVTLTISGNDFEFDQVLEDCHLFTDCADSIAERTQDLPEVRARMDDILVEIEA